MRKTLTGNFIIIRTSPVIGLEGCVALLVASGEAELLVGVTGKEVASEVVDRVDKLVIMMADDAIIDVVVVVDDDDDVVETTVEEAG